MVSGLLNPRVDLMIDMIQPVNRLHPLARGMLAKWMILPGNSGGSQFMDIWNPGPRGIPGTLSGGMNPATDWVGPMHQGAWGSITLPGGTLAYIEVGDVRISDGLAGFTASIWANPAAGVNQMLLTKLNAADPIGWAIFNKAATPSVQAVIETSAGFVVAEYIFGGEHDESIPHQYTMTYDGENIRLYIDGIERASAAQTGVTTNTDQHLLIGAEWRDGSIELVVDGRLDDAQLWNRGLSALEGQQLYRESLLGYPGLLRRIRVSRFAAAAAPAGGGIRNPFGGPMVLRNPLGA